MKKFTFGRTAEKMKRMLIPVVAITLLTFNGIVPGLSALDQAEAGVISDHAVINEILASPTGDGSAWVEVYDPTTGPFGAVICGITDNDGDSTVGAPSDCGQMTVVYKLYWISPDFLDDGGDTINLHGGSSVIDTVSYPALDPGESYARVFDGSTDFEVRSGGSVTTGDSNGVAPEDFTPPSLTVNNPIAGSEHYLGFTITYSASDDLVGVQRVQFYYKEDGASGNYTHLDTDINSANQEPYNNLEQVNSLSAGIYDICVVAVDKLGNGAVGPTAAGLANCDNSLSNVELIENVEVTDTLPPPPADPAVTLASPPDGSTTTNSAPTLAWNRSIDPSFTIIKQEIKLASSEDFFLTPVTYVPSDTATSYDLPVGFDNNDGTWYWKVILTYYRTDTSPDEVVESEVRSFTINALPDDIDAPAVPTLDYPNDGDVTNNDWPEFSWNAVSDPSWPVTYNVHHSQSSDTPGSDNKLIDSGQFDEESSTNATQRMLPFLSEGTHYWQVQACDAVGNCSDWSDPWELIVDLTPPVISIDPLSPSSNSTPTITGTFNEPHMGQIEVTIDGITGVAADSGSSWSFTTATLSPGTYTAIVKATDVAGNWSGEERMTFTVQTADTSPDDTDTTPTVTPPTPTPGDVLGATPTPGAVLADTNGLPVTGASTVMLAIVGAATALAGAGLKARRRIKV